MMMVIFSVGKTQLYPRVCYYPDRTQRRYPVTLARKNRGLSDYVKYYSNQERLAETAEQVYSLILLFKLLLGHCLLIYKRGLDACMIDRVVFG